MSKEVNQTELKDRDLEELARFAAEIVSDSFASDILLLNISNKSAFTDFMIILTVDSSRQMSAVAEDLEIEMKSKGINKSDLVKYSLAAHILAVLLVLFLALYIVVGVPGAMNTDHIGTTKECLYGDDITIVGNAVCIVDTVNDEAELHSEWYIGAAPIILLVGV